VFAQSQSKAARLAQPCSPNQEDIFSLSPPFLGVSVSSPCVQLMVFSRVSTRFWILVNPDCQKASEHMSTPRGASMASGLCDPPVANKSRYLGTKEAPCSLYVRPRSNGPSRISMGVVVNSTPVQKSVLLLCVQLWKSSRFSLVPNV